MRVGDTWGGGSLFRFWPRSDGQSCHDNKSPATVLVCSLLPVFLSFTCISVLLSLSLFFSSSQSCLNFPLLTPRLISCLHASLLVRLLPSFSLFCLPFHVPFCVSLFLHALLPIMPECTSQGHRSNSLHWPATFRPVASSLSGHPLTNRGDQGIGQLELCLQKVKVFDPNVKGCLALLLLFLSNSFIVIEEQQQRL